MAAELDSHLAQYLEANRKNGSTPKTVITPTGAFELATYRDRNSSFEPQRVKKHQTTLSDEIERKIIRMFALSMSDKAISQEISSVQPQVGSPLGYKQSDVAAEQWHLRRVTQNDVLSGQFMLRVAIDK